MDQVVIISTPARKAFLLLYSRATIVFLANLTDYVTLRSCLRGLWNVEKTSYMKENLDEIDQRKPLKADAKKYMYYELGLKILR